MSRGDRVPNLLILLSDEQEGLALGCAGHPLALTPNLDGLAARGTRFERAFTPSPICVPARASLATGRWVHETGCWDNAHGYAGQPGSWASAAGDAGFRVESVGKLHYVNAEAPTGFAAQHLPMHLSGRGVGQVWGSVRNPLPDHIGGSRLFAELGPGESDYNRHDARSAACAADWIDARAVDGEQAPPWLLFVGLLAPHFPLVVPPEYMRHLDPKSLPLPRLHPAAGHQRHPWVQRMAQFCDYDAELCSDERRRLALACYWGLVHYLDVQVGTVLQALERSGQQEHTVVLFSSDHGDNQGVRGMWNKSTLYRESTQVPLILAGPGVPIGRLVKTHASLVDVAPTVLDVVGATADPALPGKSLRKLAYEPDDPGREAFSEYHAVGSPSAAYMLRSGRWAYHHYVGYPDELFDVEADPGQVVDLAREPGYQPVRAAFETRLRARVNPEALDRQAKQDQDALVQRFGGPIRALSVGAGGATPVEAPAAASMSQSIH